MKQLFKDNLQLFTLEELSDLYVLAAEMVAIEGVVTSCSGISRAVHETFEIAPMTRRLNTVRVSEALQKLMAEYFLPKAKDRKYGGRSYYFEFREKDYEAEKEHRVMALLLMAELVQDTINNKQG